MINGLECMEIWQGIGKEIDWPELWEDWSIGRKWAGKWAEKNAGNGQGDQGEYAWDLLPHVTGNLKKVTWKFMANKFYHNYDKIMYIIMIK